MFKKKIESFKKECKESYKEFKIKVKENKVVISVVTGLVVSTIVLFQMGVIGGTAGTGAMVDDDGGGPYELDKLRERGVCTKVYTWGGPPKVLDEDVSKRSLYVCRDRYASQYDPKIKQALWSIQELDKRNYAQFNIPKSMQMIYDPLMPKKMQPDLKDFNVNGFTLGLYSPVSNSYIHVPDRELSYQHEINQKSLQEAMVMTNALLETKEANALRKEIEERFRGLSMNKNYTRFFSISGPVFLNGQTKGFVGEGEDKMAVPTHYFKIMLNPETYRSESYLIPNDVNLKDASQYRIHITEIERISGIEFFSMLDKEFAARVRQDPRELIKRKK